MIQIGGGDIQRDGHVLARTVPGRFDGLDQHAQHILVGLEERPESTLVSHARQLAPFLQDPAGLVIDVERHLQALAIGLGANSDDHEVLDVDPFSSVQATTDDLDLRQRQEGAGASSQRLVELPTLTLRSGPGQGYRHRHHRVGAEPGQISRSIQLDHELVESPLLGHLPPLQTG